VLINVPRRDFDGFGLRMLRVMAIRPGKPRMKTRSTRHAIPKMARTANVS
jgi:hypothetical protein